MAPVRRLVIDVLKPHDPPLLEFAKRVGDVEGVDGAVHSVDQVACGERVVEDRRTPQDG